MLEGDQIDFSVFALTSSGDTVDTDEIDFEWHLWLTDLDLFPNLAEAVSELHQQLLDEVPEGTAKDHGVRLEF